MSQDERTAMFTLAEIGHAKESVRGLYNSSDDAERLKRMAAVVDLLTEAEIGIQKYLGKNKAAG